ncbi:dTDP-4-amino-4,6-dideoxygalactose transaminase [Anseongella ginsenosidimutans]|uniref:dTDP-4-amino-4,6-dideoxygalactose transaminase n=1 Tax=Anseongella ginsenosidimutans TaxID=496056 RepID=A0A4R3KXK4_9SPHI|nr:DegT/DnrJ/EryC1/StrS family aminotransferase [Anseongella ginsenosidimutans]QEC51322.1 DegT/DnrJ/EryC1/StrS family aminotransferase [Anseongella ginsenosidimutans]TCS89984.1 dTDP-4-amino-4,6-dideoxygalactose transaminase [Anseongella ginsenosidimutans]
MKTVPRRQFIRTAVIAGAGLAVSLPSVARSGAAGPKPALLGGPKAHPGEFPGWPVFDQTEEKALLDVLDSGTWGRLGGSVVAAFEKEYSKVFGVNHCLGVSSGTSALYTILGAMDLGPGDEVVIPVYTFIATYNVVVLNYALPIFADTDIESFQVDANKIEEAISPQTRAIMPVHIGGSPADLDTLLAIAGKRNIPLIEDACQAHLAEWKGKKVGSYGLAGAFSFQSSKNLNSAEGGAVTTNSEQFVQACYRFHNQGQGGQTAAFNPGEGTRASNLRLTEFQGGLLLAQMTRTEEQARRRNENASYLTELLNEIPGIMPAKLYEGTTRSAWHLYMFRYDKEYFAGLSREKFIEALNAEGVPCSSGYGPMNRQDYVTGLAKNKHYLRIYGEKVMNQWLERSQCPQNDKLTTEQGVWFYQTMLLGKRTDMEQIADAIRKIREYAKELSI